ncbi:hypothetical protein ES703_92003 [subsurface metagenome]|nr:GntR family transcriptional regulator [bacterium]
MRPEGAFLSDRKRKRRMDYKNKEAVRQIQIPKTICESIYIYLRDSIVANEFEPNRKINEGAIAYMFQVSRTPVREALVRLAAEGFVEISSHRGSMVKIVSYKEIKEMFQVIGVLDCLAADLIVDRIDHDGLATLEKMTNEMERYFKDGDIGNFIEADYAIHDGVWAYLGDANDFLQKELHACILRIKMGCSSPDIVLINLETIKRSMEKHKGITEAFRTKNKEKLKIIVLEHWVPPPPIIHN